MSLNRKTRIGVIGLSGLLAAAFSVGLAATAAAATVDPAIAERVTALGFEAEALTALDEARLAGIAALLEAEHDDATLTRELGALLEGEDAAAG